MRDLDQPQVLMLATGLMILVLAAALVEALIKSRRGACDWRTYWCSLGDLAGRRALEMLPFSVAIPLVNLAWEHRFFTVPLDRWWAWALLFVGEEFCYYWYHRTSHCVRWFWATHAVHHSPNQLSFATAYRLGWTGELTGTPLFFVPLMLLGFEPPAVLAMVAINLLYQFWLHSDWIPKLGPLEYVLNTPSHHRVHHASNVEYLDANFGGVIIVFDRLFGTLVEERDDVACRYGLVKPLLSTNPVYVALHEWIALSRDLRSARSSHEVAKYLFGPPGWASAGGTTTSDLRHSLATPRPAPRVLPAIATPCNNFVVARGPSSANDSR